MKAVISTGNSLTLVLVLAVSTTAFVTAGNAERTSAQIQAEIQQLQIELQGAIEAESPYGVRERIQTQQGYLSAMYQEFPRLLGEQRYEEALLIAQRAKAVAPEDPTLKVMEDVAQQICNIRRRHLGVPEETSRILQQLEMPVALDIDSPVRLEAALKTFCDRVEVPFRFDLSAFHAPRQLVFIPQENGINLKMKTVLDLILNQLDLAYIANDECLTITANEDAAQGEVLFSRIYYVGDINNSDSLIEIIPAVIEPGSWQGKEQGGLGVLEANPAVHGLTVRQTKGVHTQIEEFLTHVREANEVNDMRRASR